MEQVVDTTISAGTLYVDFSNGWSFTGGHNATAQVVVNGSAVGAVLTVTTPGVGHVAVTGLGIAPGSRVEVVIVTNTNSLGDVSWSLGP